MAHNPGNAKPGEPVIKLVSANELDGLIEKLTCNDVMECQRARRVLVAIGEPAVPILVKALSHNKEWVRWEATKALGQIGSPAATQVLIKALEDQIFDVRWLSAEALISIGRPVVKPLLEALIAHASSIWLQEGVHHVLRDMPDEQVRNLTRPLINALEGQQPTNDAPVAAHLVLNQLRNKASHF